MEMKNIWTSEQKVVRQKQSSLLLRETDEEVIFYFNPDEFSITREEVEEEVSKLISNGYITGGDADRVPYGEIRLYVNPVTHDEDSRSGAVNIMMAKIRKTRR